MEKREGLDELTLLGNQHTRYEYDYNPDYLERIPNKHKDRDYFIKFNCPEFTSLCPITGQTESILPPSTSPTFPEISW